MKNRKVLWIHNFEPGQAKGGCWMYNQYEFFKDDVDLYFAYGLRNPLMIFVHYIKLRRIINNYRLAHAQYGSMVGFLTGLLPIPKLVSLKGSDWYKTPARRIPDRFRVALGLFLTRFSLKHLFKHAIVMSERMRKEVSFYYPNLNINVIVDPIDTHKFQPKDEVHRDIKNVLFATVALDSPVKRYQLARSAFELLERTNKNVNWYVMTNVPHAEVSAFVNNADVILLTSTHEGWPNVIKECLACNVPFVATDVSDLKEIAEQTTNCFIAEPEPSLIAVALQNAIEKGKCENLRRFVEPFAMEHTIHKYRDIYEYLTNS